MRLQTAPHRHDLLTWQTVYIQKFLLPKILGELEMKFKVLYSQELLILIIHLLACSSFLRPALSQVPLACNLMYCGEGTCVGSNSSLLGVDCKCNPGWKQLAVGTFTIPPCLLPNCTVDLSCSNTDPPSPTFPTPKNCELIWCDMGHCITNGTSHICQCVDGADNLFANPEFPCLSQCALGSDCHNLNLGGAAPPPPSGTASPSSGSKGGTLSTFPGTRFGALAVLFLSAIFAAWI